MNKRELELKIIIPTVTLTKHAAAFFFFYTYFSVFFNVTQPVFFLKEHFQV